MSASQSFKLSSRLTTGAVVGAVLTVVYIIKATFILPGMKPSLDGSVFFSHLDSGIYRAGAQVFLDGGNLYDQSVNAYGVDLPFTYPPLAAMVFSPLAFLPITMAGFVFTLATVFCMWWVMATVAGEIVPQVKKRYINLAMLALLPVALWAEPVNDTVSFGQINAILMLLVVYDVTRKKTLLPRGSFIGLAAAIKLTPAVFGLYFLVKKDWRSAGWCVASGLVCTAVAWIISPKNSVTYWFDTLHDPSRIGGLEYAGNQSLRGMVTRFVGANNTLSSVLWLILVLVVFAVIVYAMIRVNRYGHPVGMLLLNSFVALLFSPVSWSHHWVWLVVLAVSTGATALFAGQATSRDKQVRTMNWTVCAVTVAVMFLHFHWLFPHTGGAEYEWSFLQNILGNSYTLLALVIIGIACVRPGFIGGVEKQSPRRAVR